MIIFITILTIALLFSAIFLSTLTPFLPGGIFNIYGTILAGIAGILSFISFGLIHAILVITIFLSIWILSIFIINQRNVVKIPSKELLKINLKKLIYPNENYKELNIGETGVTRSVFCPSGIVEFSGKHYTAFCHLDKAIAPHKNVIIIKIIKDKIIIEEIKSEGKNATHK